MWCVASSIAARLGELGGLGTGGASCPHLLFRGFCTHGVAARDRGGDAGVAGIAAVQDTRSKPASPGAAALTAYVADYGTAAAPEARVTLFG